MFLVELPQEKLLRTPNDIPKELTKNYKYKPSACTPLFMSCYKMRDAGACIHTHSQSAVMVTLLFENKSYFEISHIEQIKALPKLQYNEKSGKVEKVGSMEYYDRLIIPIIENTPHEEDLTDSLQEAMEFMSGVKLFGKPRCTMRQLIICWNWRSRCIKRGFH